MVAKILPGEDSKYPQVVVLVGATGDLARRKLWPGLFHLSTAGFIQSCRIIGVSLDEFDADSFRKFVRAALDEFAGRKMIERNWDAFAKNLDYVPLTAGPGALRAAVEKSEQAFGGESRRLHYLSVPPSAALSAVRLLGEAGLVERSRIIMEKPFGTDLASAVSLNANLHEVFKEEQIFRIDHFLGSLHPAARGSSAGSPVRVRLVGTELDSSARRSERLAAAFRTRLARSQSRGQLTHFRKTPQ